MPESNDHSKETRGHASSWWSVARSKPAFWIILIAALGVGFLTRGGSSDSPSQPAAGSADAEVTIWTCSMHPQIKLPEPGQCPICFMDLIPVITDASDSDEPRVLTMSATARRIARIVTAPVERKQVSAALQMVGRVEYDETRLSDIAAWIPGRLDKLYADYTGQEVHKGDPLALIYSPELLAAQEELLRAIEAEENTRGSNLESFRQSVTSTVQSARDKLRLLGLNEQQVHEIENRGTTSDHITIYAPANGVIIDKHAVEGVYVKTGNPIYKIADLAVVWVELEAYESDLQWLRKGTDVTFTTEAIPGQSFTGTVSFIDPVLGKAKRTVRVRVTARNSNGQLKPGMFVRATAAGDRLRAPGASAPLVIPATAPLITGKRAVVYVELPERDEPAYEGREVILGARVGDYYVVDSGLVEGERVVVNGAFKIDSELQIRAQPSMMSPEGGAPPVHDHGGQPGQTTQPASGKTAPPVKRERLHHVPPRVEEQLVTVYSAYFGLQGALAGDDLPSAARAAGDLLTQVKALDSEALDAPSKEAWFVLVTRMTEAVEKGKSGNSDIESLRTAFEGIASVMIDIDYVFGHPDTLDHYVVLCPMAFGSRGAYWLQDQEAILNPYFGKSMLKCGKITDHITPAEGH